MNIEPVIFIVDDNQITHQVIQLIVEQQFNHKIVSYFTAQDFLKNVNPDAAGCLLVDFLMPAMTGVELYENMKEQHFSMPVIMMTSFGNIPLAVGEMKKGLFDFIEKPLTPHLLIERIQLALNYDIRQRKNHTIRQEVLTRLETLTPKEYEVMIKVVEGKPNKIIAAEMNISIKTVEKHRSRVMEKMQAKSLAQLVRFSEQCQISHSEN